jgi:ribonuclease VapC
MFIDASALVAIIADEPDGASLADRLHMVERRQTSPMAIYEATLGLLRIRGTTIGAITALLNNFMAQSRIETIPITAEIGRIEVDTFSRIGREKNQARHQKTK